jgi:hypothetical protein
MLPWVSIIEPSTLLTLTFSLGSNSAVPSKFFSLVQSLQFHQSSGSSYFSLLSGYDPKTGPVQSKYFLTYLTGLIYPLLFPHCSLTALLHETVNLASEFFGSNLTLFHLSFA